MESLKSLKKQLCDLEERLLKPETRSSPNEIEELLADDFFEFGISGNIFTKKDCIGVEGLPLFKMTPHDFEVNLLASEVALVTYRLVDETRMQHSLRSSIWKRVSGKWQMYFHQGTPTK